MLRLRIVMISALARPSAAARPFPWKAAPSPFADNDWVLPDPSRYVSAHHARVQFREGHFLSAGRQHHGVYVNDDMEPLAKRGSSGYRLSDGDVLRMGDYHIVAALEALQAQQAQQAQQTRRRPSRPAFTPCAPSGARPTVTSAHRSICMSCCSRATVRTRCCRSMPTASRSTPTGARARPTQDAEQLPELLPPDGPDPQSFGRRMARLAEASDASRGRCRLIALETCVPD